MECVNTIIELKNLPPGYAPCVNLLGYFAAGDGGAGIFYWDKSLKLDQSQFPEGEDGGIVIKPNTLASSKKGRWKRIYEGAISVKWFGAQGKADKNNANDDTKPIQMAINASLQNDSHTPIVFYPRGLYRITKKITISSSVTLRGSGLPSGGINEMANLNSTILHAFDGNLFVFDGADGLPGASGGGVERLRIVQEYSSKPPASRGAAIVFTGKDFDHKTAWPCVRDCIIEETGKGDPWSWAIIIDGVGIGNIYDPHLSNVYIHTKSNSKKDGAIKIAGCFGPRLSNVGVYDVGSRILLTGDDTIHPVYRKNKSNYPHHCIGAAFIQCEVQLLDIDFATDGSFHGGTIDTMRSTADTKGKWMINPGKLLNDFYDDPSFTGVGCFWYNPTVVVSTNGLGAGGSFRFSKPIMLNNSQWLYSLTEDGNNCRELIGLDVNNAIRLSPSGNALVSIGAPTTFSGLSNGDLVLANSNGVYFAGASPPPTPDIPLKCYAGVRLNPSNELEIGLDIPTIQIYGGGQKKIETDENGLGFFGVAPSTKPEVTGTRNGNSALTSVLKALENLGLITDNTTA